MAGLVSDYAVCAKGAICFCLDEFSKGRGARARVSGLRNAIAALEPSEYQGLTDVFDEYLVRYVFDDAERRRQIAAALKRYWFDVPTEPLFPQFPVNHIYAEGVLKALDVSLQGSTRVIPLNSWWLLDYPEVKMLTLADIDASGVTIGGRVTLLILTPRPTISGPISAAILGNTAQAWVTEYRESQVQTRSMRDIASSGT